jgi:hypothetical protein
MVRRFVATATALLLLLVGSRAFAQRQTGSVIGRVLDGQGAGLARASVTLSGAMGSSAVQSDSSGDYRFPAVEPGSYELKADLAGLSAQLRKGVVVQIAKQVVVDFTLQISGMQVDVGVAPPPIDVSASSFDDTLDQDLLFRMPFRRTAIAVTDNAPGIRDGSGFGGDETRANALLLDGVEFRDPSAGEPFVFLNYNWLDQVQVMGPGAPAEYGLFTGAIFNSVTRSGGNKHSGLFDVVYSPSRTLETSEAAVDPDRTSRYLDVSAQLSGPLVRDKLFFFAGAQRRRIETDPGGPRRLSSNTSPRLAFKLSYRPDPKDDFAALIESDQADLALQGDVPSDALTTDVDSPDLVTALQWRRSLDERTALDAKYTGWTGYFDRNPHVRRPGFRDLTSGALSGSAGRFNDNDRSRSQLNLAVSRYAEAFGKHDFRFGLEVERSHAKYRSGYVDDLYVLSDGPRPVFAYSYGYEVSASTGRDSLYVQDSWQATPRLTINPGLRFDWIRGSSPEGGRLYDVHNLQPRFGLAWDVTGSGRGVLKAHYGRYHEAALTEIWRRAAEGYRDRVLYRVGLNLLDREALLRLSRSDSIDPRLRHPYIDEVVAGYEGLLPGDVRLVVNGLWRRYADPVASVSPDQRWLSGTITNPLTGAGLTFYEPLDPTPNATQHTITNPSGFRYLDPQGRTLGVAAADRHYSALVVTASRSFAGGWLARGSYVLSKSDGDLDAQLTIAQQDRFGKYDDPNSALTNTNGELNTSRRHELKVAGSYEVPRVGLMLSAFFQWLSGQRYAALQVRSHSPGRPVFVLLLEPRGSRELPSQTSLDVRVEKTFRIGSEGGRLGAFVDATNLLDRRAVTDVNPCLPSPGDSGVVCPDLAFGAATAVQVPRQVAFGLRYTF